MADIAVVIPCYNAGAVLGRALASVFSQSLAPREIVVVDDGSDDRPGIEAIVAAAQRQGPVRMVSLSVNRGASFARNRGVEATKANYIAFLDADDVWHSRKLELQYDAMRRQGLLICGHGYVPQLLAGGFPSGLPISNRADRLRLGAFLARNPFSTPTVMVERSVFAGFDERLRRAEDYKSWILTAAKAKGHVGYLRIALAGGFKRTVGVSGLSAAVREMHNDVLRGVGSLRQDSPGIPRSFVAAALLIEHCKYPLRVSRLTLQRLVAHVVAGRPVA